MSSSDPTLAIIYEDTGITYQTDARWSYDATGYNFRYACVSSIFADGDATYRVEFKFTPTVGSQYFVIYKVDTVEVFTS